MWRDPAIRAPLRIVVVLGVMLSLSFVNLHGRDDPRPGTLSQRKWVHGWPATWLFRTWQLTVDNCQSEIGALHHLWPWITLPGEQRDYVVPAMHIDAIVAAMVLIGVMSGLDLAGDTRRFRVGMASVSVILGFLALLALLATVLPRAIVSLANVCVYSAVVFAGYALFLRVFRRGEPRATRDGTGAGASSRAPGSASDE